MGPAVQHKEPVTHDHLLQLQKFAREKQTFVVAHTYILALTLYAGCSRLNNVILLPSRTAKIEKDKVRLFLPKSKTDQMKKGLKKLMY